MNFELLLIPLGFVCGIISSTTGSPSLLSFPILLAAGYSPLHANIINTIGVAMPSTIGGSLGYRAELRNEGRNIYIIAVTGCIGGAIGAVLLLLLGSRVFDVVVPWLLIVAAVLVIAGPTIVRKLVRREESKDRVRPAVLFTFAGSIYGGYFGAGVGPILVAAYVLLLRGGIQRANSLKVVVVLASNATAAIYFALFGPVEWRAVVALVFSSIAGGYVGAHTARRMPDWLLRSAVAVGALLAAIVQIAKP